MDTNKEKKYLSTIKQASNKIKELIAENNTLKEQSPIAVIGMSCRFPGADNPEDFWQMLLKGEDAIRTIPEDRFKVEKYFDPVSRKPGTMYTNKGGFLDDPGAFDPHCFGMSLDEARWLDPQQRLLMEVSWEALERAGQDFSKIKGSNTGIFLGMCNQDYYLSHIGGDTGNLNEFTATGSGFSTGSGRLAYIYDFRGPAITIDTACSSSLVALNMAAQNIENNLCDMALVGGVSLMLRPEPFVAFSAIQALSPDGKCRTFDASANGYGRGEGCGVVVLKRLSSAISDKDPILAVIKGTALNQDGTSSSLTAPNAISQQNVINKAHIHAGVNIDDVDYIELHGTGTSLGDPIEARALGMVFNKRKNLEKVIVGSVKTNIGHLEAASGIAGFIKTILALQHRQIPSSLNFKEPSPHIPWDELPIQVADRVIPWPEKQGDCIAGISSFGYSGTNAHIVICNAPECDNQKTYGTYAFQRQSFPIHPPVVGTDAKISNSINSSNRKDAEIQDIEKKEVSKERQNITIENILIPLLDELLPVRISSDNRHLPLISIGANSIIFTRLQRKIESSFGVSIPLRNLFDDISTIDALISYIEKNQKSIEPSTQTTQSIQTRRSTESTPPVKENYSIEENFVELTNNDTPPSINSIFQQQLKTISETMSEVVSKQLEFLKTSNLSTDKERPEQESDLSQIKPLNHSLVINNSSESVTLKQGEFLSGLIARYIKRTKTSKELAERYRPILSDWINTLNFRMSIKEIQYPIVSNRSAGAYLWDVDQNKYIDMAMGYGVNFLGNNPSFISDAIESQLKKGSHLGPQSDLTGEVAELICEISGMDRVTFCNSGTEAVMFALRIARAVTGRDKIVIFSGSFHGTFDGVLAAEGENGVIPQAPGIPQSMIKEVLVLDYDSEKSLEIIRKKGNELAAVLTEPVQSRKPGVQPASFLKKLRTITKKTGTALIFDEMITGFRIGLGGAQEFYGIRADIATYGKILAGGMPIGVFAGASEFLDAIDGGQWSYGDDSSPGVKTTLFGGTFCKHPLTMAACKASLNFMKEQGPALQENVNKRTEYFAKTLNTFFEEHKCPVRIHYFSSLFRFESFGRYDLSLFPIEMDILFYLLMEKGVYTWERRICFFSISHTDDDIEFIINAVKESILELRKGGFHFSLDDESEPETAPISLEIEETYPMSSSQKRLFVLSQLESDEIKYQIKGAVLIEGDLDIDRFKLSFMEIVKRHESLRTGFEMQDDKFIQRVHDNVDFKIITKKIDESESEQFIDFFSRPFDLSSPPLIRIGLAIFSKNRHLMVMDAHHIAIDGSSFNIIVQEFITLYEGKKLAPVQNRYREYVAWEHNHIVSDAVKKQEQYWIDSFSDEIPVLNLPLDYQRGSRQSFKGDVIYLKIDQLQTNQLMELAKETRATLFMVLLSAFKILLSKLTSQEDILTGIPIDSRSRGDFDQTVGMFANTLVIRSFPVGSKRYKDFLNEVKEKCLNAYENQDYPFDLFVDKLALQRDMSRNPLFDAQFVFEDGNRRIFKIEELTFTTCDANKKSSMFDLTLEVTEARGHLDISLEYCTKLFKKETIQRWSCYFQNILGEIIKKPDIFISDMEILPSAERRRLIDEFNNTEADYPCTETLVSMFEARAAKNPDNLALIFKNKRLSYKKLNESANQLAHILREEHGVSGDDPVGIMVERSEMMIIGIFGILKAGGAYVPIHPEYPQERVKYILENSCCKIILTESKFLDGLRGDSQAAVLDIGEMKGDKKSNLEQNISAGNLAYIIYTSGSTGHPKGVMIEHGSVINRIHWMHRKYPITPEQDIILQKTPFTFDVSVWELFWWSFYGLPLCLLEPGGEKDPGIIVRTIRENHVTVIHFVPPMLNAFLEYLEHGSQASQIKCLRHVFASGEALSCVLVEKFNRLLGRRYNIQLHNLYGPTEATVDVTYFDCPPNFDLPVVPIGKPVDNTQIYLMDRDMKHPSPTGVVGEICIGGALLARGYLNKPGLTKEKFIPHPFTHKNRIYRTGDLGKWWPDGNIEYLGRTDHQVKIRGFRIEPGEIENALGKHPHIRQTVVLAKELGSDVKELVAYIVSSKDISRSDLKAYIGKILPDYMIPAYFVFLDNFPLNPSGKIDRKILPDPVQKSEMPYAPPVTEMEKTLADIWMMVLGRKEIGIHDNFFAIGGDSIKAIQIISRMHRENLKLQTRHLFDHPTISELSEKVSKFVSETSAEQETVFSPESEHSGALMDLKNTYPMSSPQKRLFLLSQLESDEIQYHINGAILIDGDLDIDRFELSFIEIIKRHESLRTGFEMQDDTLFQRVHDNVDFKIITKKIDENEIEQLIDDFIRVFDLSTPPLIRTGLASLRKDRHLMVIDAHHIAIDGYSFNIIVQEIITLYQGKSLSPVKKTYSEYAIWEQEHIQSDTVKKQERYWIDCFSDEIPVLNLPLDYQRGSRQSFQGDVIHLEIGQEQTNQLKGLANETGTTLFMILLSAFNILLFKLTGEEDIITGMPIDSRFRKNFDYTVGMFANTLVLRNFPAGDKTYMDFLNEVKTHCLDAYENQDYPFDVFVNKLDLKRDMSRNPLFDVMFVYVNANERIFKIKDLSFHEYTYNQKSTNFDFTVEFIEEDNHLHLNVKYCTKLFKKKKIERWSDYLIKIMHEIVLNKNMKLSDIDHLPLEEKQKLLIDFNDTKTAHTHEKSVVDMFEYQVKKNPGNIAVVFKDQKLNYNTLNMKANQLARHLKDNYDIGSGDFVCMMVQLSEHLIVGMLAIIKTGAAFIPVDPDAPPERVDYISKDCNFKLIITDSRTKDKLLSDIPVIQIDKETFDESPTNLNIEIMPSDVLSVIYTSGSTGRPKGVLINHKGMVNHITWFINDCNIKENDSSIILASYAFDAPYTNIWGMLFTGSCLHIVSDRILKDIEQLIDYIVHNDICFLKMTPSLFHVLVHAANASKLSSCNKLRLIMLGGEAIRTEDVMEFRSINSRTEFINHYGPTETTIGCIATHINNIEDFHKRPVIGKPIANTSIYILDRYLKPVSLETTGEIHIGGPGLSNGYKNRDNLTKEKFIANPFQPGEFLYKTGDLGRWLSDGMVECLGRIDNQIKIRGFRIEPEEIESLISQHDDIGKVAVIAKKMKRTDKELIAYITCINDLEISDLKAYLKSYLPNYMIPAYFVKLENMPMTRNNKINRKMLPAPLDTDNRISDEIIPPATSMEIILVNILKDLLVKDNIGINHDFFELGGDSITAIQVVSRLKKKNLNIKFHHIFEYSKIEETAKKITGQDQIIKDANLDFYGQMNPDELKEHLLICKIKEDNIQDIYPLSPMQEGMLFHALYDGDSAAFLQIDSFPVTGNFDINIFEKSWNELFKRYDIFRTLFLHKGLENPLQIVLKEQKIVFSFNDISYLDKRQQDSFIVKCKQEEESLKFDLSRDVLMRIKIIASGKSNYEVIWTRHHILMDGWCSGIIINELFTIYKSLEKGVNPDLQTVIPYSSYISWLKTQTDPDAAKQYWKDFLSDYKQIATLSDPSSLSNRSGGYEIKAVRDELSVELTQKLRQLAIGNRVTLNTVVQSIWAVLLGKYNHVDDVIFGLVVSGRPPQLPGVENIVGLFINTVPVRIKTEKTEKFSSLIKKVQKQFLESEDFHYNSLADLQATSNLKETLIDHAFVFENFPFSGKLHDIIEKIQLDFSIGDVDEGILQTNYDYSFACYPLERIIFEIKYNADIFSDQFMELILRQYVCMAKAVVENETLCISEIRTEIIDNEKNMRENAFVETFMSIDEEF